MTSWPAPATRAAISPSSNSSACGPRLAGGVPRGGDRRGRGLLRIPDRRPVHPRRAIRSRRRQAFHNTCLHRGTRLAEGNGHFDDACIRCRYHAWRYDLDGTLIEVVDPGNSHPCRAVSPRGRCESNGGVASSGSTWTREATRCSSTSTPYPSSLAPYHLDRMRMRSYRATSSPPTGRSSSTPSTRATTCKGRIRRSCRGPMMSTSSTSRWASTPITAVCPTPGGRCVRAHASGCRKATTTRVRSWPPSSRDWAASSTTTNAPSSTRSARQPPDGETMLSRYQKGRRQLLAGGAWQSTSSPTTS